MTNKVKSTIADIAAWQGFTEDEFATIRREGDVRLTAKRKERLNSIVARYMQYRAFRDNDQEYEEVIARLQQLADATEVIWEILSRRVDHLNIAAYNLTDDELMLMRQGIQVTPTKEGDFGDIYRMMGWEEHRRLRCTRRLRVKPVDCEKMPSDMALIHVAATSALNKLANREDKGGRPTDETLNRFLYDLMLFHHETVSPRRRTLYKFVMCVLGNMPEDECPRSGVPDNPNAMSQKRRDLQKQYGPFPKIQKS